MMNFRTTTLFFSILIIKVILLQACSQESEDCNVLKYFKVIQTTSTIAEDLKVDVNEDGENDFRIFVINKAGNEGDSIIFGIEPLNASEIAVFEGGKIAASFIQELIFEEFNESPVKYEWSNRTCYLGATYETTHKTLHQGYWAQSSNNRASVGIRLYINKQVHYAWIRIETEVPGELYSEDQLTVYDYGFHTIANEDILSGSKSFGCDDNWWLMAD